MKLWREMLLKAISRSKLSRLQSRIICQYVRVVCMARSILALGKTIIVHGLGGRPQQSISARSRNCELAATKRDQQKPAEMYRILTPKASGVTVDTRLILVKGPPGRTRQKSLPRHRVSFPSNNGSPNFAGLEHSSKGYVPVANHQHEGLTSEVTFSG
jgi:hypothetical protein